MACRGAEKDGGFGYRGEIVHHTNTLPGADNAIDQHKTENAYDNPGGNRLVRVT